jgi:hypothetical protein
MSKNHNTPQAFAKPPKPAHPSPSQPIFLPLFVLFFFTIAAQLVSLAFGRADQELSFASAILPSVLFLSVISLPAIWLGLALGGQIGLGTPSLTALLSGETGGLQRLGKDTIHAGVLGVALGGLLLLIRQISQPYLPPEIPAYGHRGVLGGLSVSFGAAVAEEVWFRLGLMTLLVWCGVRFSGDRISRPMLVWSIIVLSSVAFGMAHLPQLMSYGAGSRFAIGGTVLGNTAVGILYGWCYWKRSLIAAMVAHFCVDIVIHVLPAFSHGSS